MTKIDIISGFLGAGKTTLINRLIHEAYQGEKLVLIENEFGQIGIDGDFLQNAGVQITQMNSGCICCSLVGDFSKALKQVITDYAPDRILIEPSGVGKLSDVTKAVLAADLHDAVLNSAVVVVDVNKCKMYMKNFGEFFNDQISHAGCILFSHTDKTTDEKLTEALKLVREHNTNATVITTPADQLETQTLIAGMEQISTLENHLKDLMEEESCPICGHHHHDEGHDHECHHHDHDEDHDHECHHHDHDEDHDHECHHHHHHADDIFTSWGAETVQKYSSDEIKVILNALSEKDKYGIILRSKGIVQTHDGNWINFDYVPGEPDVRDGSPVTIGKICVIGSQIHEEALQKLFHL